MLRAVHGNRVEGLLAALLEALPPADPFAPSTIVVGSHLVARWLRREIAFARGVAAGLDLPTFDAFVERTWGRDDAARMAGLVGLDRRRIAIAIASVLADDDRVATLPAVAAYLAAAPGGGDLAGPRRVQLADHLADLVWAYATSRPDWMPALLAGRVPGELTALPSAHWQAALLHAAIDRVGPTAVPGPSLPWQRKRVGLAPPRLDGAVAVFGVTHLARAQLEALTDLAQTTDVTVYALDPCEELWDDVGGRRVMREDVPRPLGDPLPLVLWGRPMRDTLASLVERTGGDFDARFASDAGTPRGDTARDRLLDDVRARRVPAMPAVAAMAAIASLDPGVRVLACPNARRELEIVAAEVRRALDADPTLSAHEIAVWVASERDVYLAGAPAAFDAVGVPCHLVDAPIDDRGRIGEAALALLALPTGDQSRRELLRVMTHPAVLAAHPHVDAGDWVRWTDRLGIVHGASHESHAGTYLESHPGQFHWDQGVRRLALGAFMIGDRPAVQGTARPTASIGGVPFVPEEVRPDQQASAATYALLVRSLSSDAEWLAAHVASLGEWAAIFAGLVDTYLAPRDDEAKRDIERVRGLLAGLGTLDLDGRELGFREARAHATRLLEGARSDRGESLAAGVMVAPLGASRALPFRHAFLVGLTEGAFPAADRPSPLDLRIAARAGDVSPRDRDRAAFLDALLCARDGLTLSYVAAEPKSGQALAPSSVILELADSLAPYLGAASSREALARITTKHPLHRFGPGEAGVLPAVHRERWAVTVRDALRSFLRDRGHAVPDADGQLALLAHPAQAALRAALGIEAAPVGARLHAVDRPISIASLRNFLVSPVQAWAQLVLDLDELPDELVAQTSDEPFHQSQLDRAMVLREVLAAHLRDPGRGLPERYDEAVATLVLRGHFPVGVFQEAARTVDLGVLETWRETLGPVAVGLGRTTRFGFGRAIAPWAELRPALTLQLSGGRTVRLVGQTELLLVEGGRYTSVVALVKEAKKDSHYHLRGAFDHVVLAAAGLANAGHTHRLVGGDGKECRVEHAPLAQAEARAYLAALVTELVDQPHGYLLPFEALVHATVGKPLLARYRDALGFGPIEREDGLALPLDAIAIAERRFAPLVALMSGGHAFARADDEPGGGGPARAPRRGSAPPAETTAPATRVKTVKKPRSELARKDGAP